MAVQKEAQDHCSQPAFGNGVALEATHAQVGAPGRVCTARTAAPLSAGTIILEEVEKKEQDGCGQPASGMALEAAHAQVGAHGVRTVRTAAPLPAGTIILAEVEKDLAESPRKIQYPPGWRFLPRDDELLTYYLWPKISKKTIHQEQLIHDVDIYRFNPNDLATIFEPAAEDRGQNHWYFFTPRQKKYPKGTRPRRDAGGGHWKATGSEMKICNERGETIGVKTTLVFCTTGNNGEETKNNWIQQEYRYTDLKGIPRTSSDDKCRLDDVVLAKIYYHPLPQRNGQDQALRRTVRTPRRQQLPDVSTSVKTLEVSQISDENQLNSSSTQVQQLHGDPLHEEQNESMMQLRALPPAENPIQGMVAPQSLDGNLNPSLINSMTKRKFPNHVIDMPFPQSKRSRSDWLPQPDCCSNNENGPTYSTSLPQVHCYGSPYCIEQHVQAGVRQQLYQPQVYSTIYGMVVPHSQVAEYNSSPVSSVQHRSSPNHGGNMPPSQSEDCSYSTKNDEVMPENGPTSRISPPHDNASSDQIDQHVQFSGDLPTAEQDYLFHTVLQPLMYMHDEWNSNEKTLSGTGISLDLEQYLHEQLSQHPIFNYYGQLSQHPVFNNYEQLSPDPAVSEVTPSEQQQPSMDKTD